MSVNFTNDLNSPSNSSFSPPDLQCVDSTVGRYVLTAISFTYSLLVLPLSVLVLYLGFQRWRQQLSVSSAATTTHSDFFTYNMAIIELVGISGNIFHYFSSYTDHPDTLVGIYIGSFIWPGQILFPILICVERYLAVVHPIIYRGLRHTGGVMIRNISTGCIWLNCFVWLCLLMLLNIQYYYRRVLAAFLLILSLIVMMFCSLSVLRILIRPRPGKVDSNRARVDQLKQRAICTVLVVMAVLWMKFSGNAIVIIFRFSPLVSVKCVGEALTFLFFLPCGVVLPLLFLHRAGKLPNCKHAG